MNLAIKEYMTNDNTKYNPDLSFDPSECVEGPRSCGIACTKSTGEFDEACFYECMKNTFIC
jgi:hypothetical protein